MSMLEEILKMSYNTTPIKIETGRGLGELQKAARNITLGKIIFILCKEGPLTKYQIADMGNIHKSSIGDSKDTITHRLNDLIKLDMIFQHKPIIPEGIRNKALYTFTYYLADWGNPLTRYMFQWYRDQFSPSHFYLTEYEELEHELDMQMVMFKHFEKDNPDLLKKIILQEEIADLFSNVQKLKPLDKKSNQPKEGVNIDGIKECLDKIEILKDKSIAGRDNLLQLLSYANVNKEPMAMDEPLKVIRQLLKQRMLRLDSLGHLDHRGNIHQLSKLANLANVKSTTVFDLIVQLKIEKKLPDFIAVWKRLIPVAQKSESIN